jgi:hypothetical protein
VGARRRPDARVRDRRLRHRRSRRCAAGWSDARSPSPSPAARC